MQNHNNYAPWYPEVERIIKKYWKDCEHLKRLLIKEKLLIERIAQIQEEMKALDELPGVRETHGIVPGSIRSQKERDLSDLMVIHEADIDRCFKELVMCHKNLNQVRRRIFNIQIFLSPIQLLMDKLTDEEKQLTELRYVYRYSNYQIGYRLNCSEFRVRELKNRIINNFAEWLGKKENRNFNATDCDIHDKLVS